MKDCDGWTFKVSWGRGLEPYLLPGYFHMRRSEVIKDFEKTEGLSWKNYRRKGIYKIVKVRLMEVE